MNAVLDMSRYVPPEQEWTLRLRSTDAFREKLAMMVRLWKAHAQARGDDADKIDISYVVRRTLEQGLDQAFTEYGGIPKTEQDWVAIETAINKSVKKRG